MAPEFSDGEIIVIEPDGALRDGSFVLAQPGGEWTFRQLARSGSGWLLHALNPAYADQPLPDLTAVHGVVIQKCVPGRRRLTKHYL
jgi:DNA polymerase V